MTASMQLAGLRVRDADVLERAVLRDADFEDVAKRLENAAGGRWGSSGRLTRDDGRRLELRRSSSAPPKRREEEGFSRGGARVVRVVPGMPPRKTCSSVQARHGRSKYSDVTPTPCASGQGP